MISKTASLAALVLGVTSTFLLTVGLGHAAAKLDPVLGKSRVLSADEIGDVANSPCVACIDAGVPVRPSGDVAAV